MNKNTEQGVVKLQEKLNTLTEQIEEKENYLNKLKLDIASRETVLNSTDLQSEDKKKLEDQITLKDKTIENLKSQVEDAMKLKNYIDDLKKLEISKDMQINKLIDQNTSKEKEIERLNILLKEDSSKTRDENVKENEEVARFKLEISKYENKVNDLELKIYQINDEKKHLEKEKEKFKTMWENSQIELEQKREKEKENEKENNENEKLDIINNNYVSKEQYYQLEKEKNILAIDVQNLEKEKADLTISYQKLEKEMRELQDSYKSVVNANVNSISLEKLLKEQEEEKIHGANLIKERTELENKITNMKSALQEIKEKFELELARKDKIINEKLLQDQKASEAAINSLTLKVKSMEDVNKGLKKKVSIISKEKLELEDIIIKQEEKVNELGNKVNMIDTLLKDKNKELKENEQYALKLVNIIEDQKKVINDIRNKGKEGGPSEVAYLKNQITNLRREIEAKDNKINNLQVNNRIIQEKLIKQSVNKGVKLQEEQREKLGNRHKQSSKALETYDQKREQQEELELEENAEVNEIPSGRGASDMLPMIEINNKIRSSLDEVDENKEQLEEITNSLKKILDEC